MKKHNLVILDLDKLEEKIEKHSLLRKTTSTTSNITLNAVVITPDWGYNDLTKDIVIRSVKESSTPYNDKLEELKNNIEEFWMDASNKLDMGGITPDEVFEWVLDEIDILENK